jgi:hypothetical protein
MPSHSESIGKGVRTEKCFRRKQKRFIPQKHQKKVKDYFLNSPYRGLLLYHKLGSGKTCTSIIIADEMLRKKMVEHVYVCTPGSLRSNFINEYCELCGDQEKLKDKFTFITYNTQIENSLKRLDFNNSLVIIDEVHNLVNSTKNISKNAKSLFDKILKSNARVLLLTATVLYNNIYEWSLLGNLLKDNTFPNIVKSGELDIPLFDTNIKEIFSKKNLEGIISYYPGYDDTDYPKVIEHKPIYVPMTYIQTERWYKINEIEILIKKRGPPKPSDYRKNFILAKEANTRYILALKYIMTRSISNAVYMSFMIRKELNDDEKKSVDNYLTNYFKDAILHEEKKTPLRLTTEELFKKNKKAEKKAEKFFNHYKKFIKVKTGKKITKSIEKSLVDLIEFIIKELNIMAPTYTSISNLHMTNIEIKDFIEQRLIEKKYASKAEFNDINVMEIIEETLENMKKIEDNIIDSEESDDSKEDEEVEKEIEDEEFNYCIDCKELLNKQNIHTIKSYRQWILKNNPDKKKAFSSKEDTELHKKIKSCYHDWSDINSKCVNITGQSLINLKYENDNNIVNICGICCINLKDSIGVDNYVYKLKCGDVFHFSCIDSIMKIREHEHEDKKCPVCNIHIEGKISKKYAKMYNYIEVTDKLVENGGWISRDIFKNKFLTRISPKILTVILNIFKNYNSKHVIFSYFIEKSGIRLISNILKVCGIKTIIYHGDISSEKRAQLLKNFNSKNNLYGNIFKVFLATDAGIEGITIKDVNHVHILETNPIPNKSLQAIGRVVRYKSHQNLPKNERVVNIWKYYSTPIKYSGKMEDFDTINTELNTFDEYYDYYVKEGYVEYLNKKYGKNAVTYETGTDEELSVSSEYKIEKFKEVYDILKENSIEHTGLINKYEKEDEEDHEDLEEEENEENQEEDLEEEDLEEEDLEEEDLEEEKE